MIGMKQMVAVSAIVSEREVELLVLVELVVPLLVLPDVPDAAVEVTDKQLDQVTSGGDIVTVDVSGLKDVDSAKGTGETTFSPNADCTRAQIVTLLWRCKK